MGEQGECAKLGSAEQHARKEEQDWRQPMNEWEQRTCAMHDVDPNQHDKYHASDYETKTAPNRVIQGTVIVAQAT